MLLATPVNIDRGVKIPDLGIGHKHFLRPEQFGSVFYIQYFVESQQSWELGDIPILLMRKLRLSLGNIPRVLRSQDLKLVLFTPK